MKTLILKNADVITCTGDPLANISLLENYHENITLIMQAGAIYKNIL